MSTLTEKRSIGLVVDAGSRLGYGHAVRCLRLARALEGDVEIFPLSTECADFFQREGFQKQIRATELHGFPAVVVTDLRECNGITAAIHAQGALHVSIHDLGLAQCRSDVAIDGSVVQLIPFAPDKNRTLFLGPSYMIGRRPIAPKTTKDTVLVTLGGGASAEMAVELAEQLKPLGLRAIATEGFGSRSATPESVIEDAMSRCLFAISASGTALYDLLASGIPTIAVALDPLQLRTADAFHEIGAALSAGLLDRLSRADLMARCRELIGNGPLTSRMMAIGRKAVDGKGLERVVGILEHLRSNLWLTKEAKTCTTF